MAKEKTKDSRIRDERKRLLTLLGAPQLLRRKRKDDPDVDPALEASLGLIDQAAALRIMLEDLQADLLENGQTEEWQRSSRSAPTVRQRPESAIYTAQLKTYALIVKQLVSLLDGGEENPAAASLLAFVNRSR